MKVQGVKGLPSIGVLRPEGPIDFRNVDALRAAAADGKRRGRRTLIVDLSDVRYINSFGMSALLALSDDLSDAGGSLVLAAAPPKLKVVLDLMGISAMLPMRGSVVSAVRSLVKRQPQRLGSR
ncbi:MAG TPA: STAS domain-containing protein [Planctomycetota bacterium]